MQKYHYFLIFSRKIIYKYMAVLALLLAYTLNIKIFHTNDPSKSGYTANKKNRKHIASCFYRPDLPDLRKSLFDYDIDQLAGNGDQLDHIFAAAPVGQLFMAFDHSFQLIFTHPGRYIQTPADLTVYLDYYLYGILRHS